MTLSNISVKTFIPDLARLLNENFSKIQSTIAGFYNDTTKTITANEVDVTGKVSANSITASYITLRMPNGSTVTLSEIINRLKALEDNQ